MRAVIVRSNLIDNSFQNPNVDYMFDDSKYLGDPFSLTTDQVCIIVVFMVGISKYQLFSDWRYRLRF